MTARPVRLALPVVALSVALLGGVATSPAFAAPAPGPQPRVSATLTPPTTVSRERLTAILGGATRATDAGLERGTRLSLVVAEGGGGIVLRGRARDGRLITTSPGLGAIGFLDVRTRTRYVPIGFAALGAGPELVEQALEAAGRPGARWVTVRGPRTSLGVEVVGDLRVVGREARQWTWSRTGGLTRWTIDGRDTDGDYRLVLVLDSRQRVVREVLTRTLDGVDVREAASLTYARVAPVRLPAPARTIPLRTLLRTIADL